MTPRRFCRTLILVVGMLLFGAGCTYPMYRAESTQRIGWWDDCIGSDLTDPPPTAILHGAPQRHAMGAAAPLSPTLPAWAPAVWPGMMPTTAHASGRVADGGGLAAQYEAAVLSVARSILAGLGVGGGQTHGQRRYCPDFGLARQAFGPGSNAAVVPWLVAADGNGEAPFGLMLRNLDAVLVTSLIAPFVGVGLLLTRPAVGASALPWFGAAWSGKRSEASLLSRLHGAVHRLWRRGAIRVRCVLRRCGLATGRGRWHAGAA